MNTPTSKPQWQAATEKRDMVPAERAKVALYAWMDGQVKRSSQTIKAFLPETEDVDRFTRIITRAVVDDPVMQEKCGNETFRAQLWQLCIDCAILGVEPNTVTQEAAIIPYGAKPELIVMSNGLIKIAKRNGSVVWAKGIPVFAKDEFADDPVMGTINHRPYRGRENPGELICAYAVAQKPDGTIISDVVAGWEVLRIKAASLAKAKNPDNPKLPWNQFEHRMWAKTALRRLLKSNLHETAQIMGHMDRAEEGETIRNVTPPRQPQSVQTEEARIVADLREAAFDPGTGEVIEIPAETPATTRAADIHITPAADVIKEAGPQPTPPTDDQQPPLFTPPGEAEISASAVIEAGRRAGLRPADLKKEMLRLTQKEAPKHMTQAERAKTVAHFEAFERPHGTSDHDQ